MKMSRIYPIYIKPTLANDNRTSSQLVHKHITFPYRLQDRNTRCKILKTGCPDYLRQSVHFYTPYHHLRSTNPLLLSKPTARTVIIFRCFQLSLSYHLERSTSRSWQFWTI